MVDFAARHESNTTPEDRFERLSDLSPSAKFVYWALDDESPRTQSDLVDETLLPERTLRDALSRLTDADLVVEERQILDARKKRYRPKEVARP